MKVLFLILSLLAVPFVFSADLCYEINTARPAGFKLPPGIRKTAEGFRMHNGTQGIVIPGSENFRFAASGLTVMATLCMDKTGVNSLSRYADGSFVDNYHIIASKGKEFVFGRRGDNWVDQFYFNFSVNGKWQVPLDKTLTIPAYGKTFHAAMTLRRDHRPGDDRNHYICHIYINGVLKYSGDCRSDQITTTGEPVIIGRGEGLLGRQWCFPGTFDEVKVINRALSAEEILAAAMQSRRVKISIPDRALLTPELMRKFENIEKSAAAPGRWAVDTLRRAARNCYDQKTISTILDRLAGFSGEKDFDRFARIWNDRAKPFQIVPAGSRLSLMLATGRGRGAFPLLDMYDRKSRRGMFGSDTLKWQLCGMRLNGKKETPEEFSCFSPAWETGKIRNENGMSVMDIRWHHKKVAVQAVMRFGRNRCDFRFSAENKDENLRIEELRFPVFTLRQLKGPGEALIVPRMNGQRIARPLENPNQIPPEAGQPSSMASMQFCGYRDDRTALYIGTEDPAAGARHFEVQPLQEELRIIYRQPAAFSRNGKGGNQTIAFSGTAAIEMLSGDWYDIGQTYRRFLEKDAPWWIPELPRKSTPEWMRNNVLWLLVSSESADGNLQAFMEDLCALRKYIDLPIAAHVYGWNDYKGKGDMPNFYARSAAVAAVAELKQKGFRVLPYFDTLLWSLTDGPGFKAKEFPTKGRAAAYLKRDGSMHLQTWGRPRRQYAVMCPAVPLWQKRMEYMCRHIMDNCGFDGIYHDQVAGNYARACYSKNHPHLPGDPLAWNRGWKELFALQDNIRKTHPEMITTSEDSNETHLRYFDGFLVWRWLYRNQIPLFNSLYSGRVQFVGRVFDQARKGDPEDYYPKAASQLLYGEQLGWMIPRSLAKYPERRRFVKQMCHLRHALLEYFNCGSFERPLEFKRPPAQRELLWGNPGTPQKVVTDKIMHSVFRLKNNRIITFVNTSPDRETVYPAYKLAPEEEIAVCDPAVKQLYFVKSMPDITLPGRGFALLLAGKRSEIQAEAQRLFRAVKKIDAFDYGQNIFATLPVSNVQVGVTTEFSGMYGKNLAPFSGDGCFVLTGNGKKRAAENLPINGLKRNTRYRITMAVRADKKVSAAVVVGQADQNWKPVYWLRLGGKAPSDGKWHQISGEFTTGTAVFHPWVMIYNDSKGNYSVDRILIEEIKQ